ncbi:ABC transporter substrate-binding protein [Sporolactobacillus sp. THM19-2]|uniref:ABC transporter substrate-binding protein n=1 Tax=Sporolactobacillus sp. THM19-2 TaxID=2511171 RepID=UPI00101FE203|nr:sugar ABC transporter substrate-binding protein [Sporolactobacillus sp. THM19-2]RYL86661.1 sugar ABC transporter substrate-binding protein [Sporolactobacillus sp. THM19-2]
MGKKWFSKILLCLMASVLVVGMTACSSGGQSSVNSGGKANLKIATWAGATELKEFQGIVNKLNKKSDEYHLTVQSIPADYYKKIQTMASAKQAPDLFLLSQEYIPMYADLGVISPIDNYVKNSSKVDLKDYYKGPLDASKYKNKLYGLPWISQPVMLYYNKTMFEKAGVSEPAPNWSWEDFETAAKALTKDNNKDGKTDQFGTNIDGWPPLSTWIWTYGGDTITKNGKVVINSPESIDGLKMMNKLINVDKVVPNKTQSQNAGGPQMFSQGKIAMIFGGAGDDFEKQVGNKFELGMTEIPHNTQKATFSWIASTVMANTTKNKDTAADALIDLTNAMHDWKVLPPTKSDMAKMESLHPEKKYAIPALNASSQYSHGYNNQVKQIELDTAMYQYLYEPIMLGKKSPEKAAKETADHLKQIQNQ